MRLTLPALLICLCTSVAWPKEDLKKEPIFMAPDFHFNQIDTICVAPTIDLRPDKTQPLALSGHLPSGGGGLRGVVGEILTGPRVHLFTADEDLAGGLKGRGYKTVSCKPVNATLDDLKRPSDAWLRQLDFGESRWLFILAVEYVSIVEAVRHAKIIEKSGRGCRAIVSGYLLDKQAAAGRLVWRDKVVGGDILMELVAGGKDALQLLASERAISNGIAQLVEEFEGKSHASMDISHKEIFDVTCNGLWTALSGTLKNSEKYILQIDDFDMTAIYAKGRESKSDLVYTNLKPKGNGCSMQFTEAPRGQQRHTVAKDAKALFKRLHRAL